MALAWALLAALSTTAAQERLRRVGLLHVGIDHMPPAYEPLRAGMRELGYEEGRNIRYEFHNVADQAAAAQAAEALTRERVDVIVAFDNEACDAAHKATTQIPVVMLHAGQPVAAGYAQSLTRPGGNMTGFGGRAQLPAKEMEILREIAPRVRHVLLLFDSQERASIAWRKDARDAAERLGFTLHERDAHDEDGVRRVFSALKPGEVEVVMFAANGLRHRHMRVLIAQAQAASLLLVGNRRDEVERGALFAYSYDFSSVGHAAAGRYLHRVLRGESPASLPIEEVTEYGLAVNAAVARKAGLVLSPSVQIRAEKIFD
jgi:putative ABC transport system substrate-binding protein